MAIKKAHAQAYVGLRAWCHPDQACEFIGSAQRQLFRLLKPLFVRPAGPSMARYHDEGEEAWDIEVCVPVNEKPAATLPSDTILGELPEGWVAFTVHDGDCGGHGSGLWRRLALGARARLRAWGGPNEVYLFDGSNTEDAAYYRTELAWMVRGVSPTS